LFHVYLVQKGQNKGKTKSAAPATAGMAMGSEPNIMAPSTVAMMSATTGAVSRLEGS
jgi:hypothetical protein